MKRFLTTLAALAAAMISMSAQTCWTIQDDESISLNIGNVSLPYSDHIEMSGEQISCVIRWEVDGGGHFNQMRSLVFPMLRTVPNNTHASLMYRMSADIMSLVGVSSLAGKQLSAKKVTLDGTLSAVCDYGLRNTNVNGQIGDSPAPVIEVTTRIFPSTTLPMLCETYSVRNITGQPVIVNIPEFKQVVKTPKDRGVDGAYVVRGDIFGSGTFVLEPQQTVDFQAAFQAYRDSGEKMTVPDVNDEYAARMSFVRSLDSSLVLETPDPAIDDEFRFAKIRATESIYRTKGGLMHGPGGESYYAALWCNDQCEYANPFFPFLGNQNGNESAFNCYRPFARFMNDEFKPIPSSIIAEGLDIWDGAGDRGDAAMVAHGLPRYLLASGNLEQARELWPFLKWCLEYCHRKLNADGVPESDTDELEGRFPAGKANLSTACLYYDGLVSATHLAPLMGEPASVTRTYRRQATELKAAVERYFGGTVSGYDTYKYYDGNDVLRSWICLPLCFGINDRAKGTLDAWFSPLMRTEDGIRTQHGITTCWDRSTLYARRGAFAAGHSDEAVKQLSHYSQRRLLGTHVPYPVEAYPEGSQRHLSAESGLFCRVITEGLFGIRPTGFNSFSLKTQLPSGWDRMALRHIKAFASDFDIEAVRVSPTKIKVTVSKAGGKTKEYVVKPGQLMSVTLN